MPPNPAYGYNVVLEWTPPTGASEVAGYRLFRQRWAWDSATHEYDTLVDDYGQIQTIDDGSHDTTDAATTCGYFYKYYVVAYDAFGGVSDRSNEATANLGSCYAG